MRKIGEILDEVQMNLLRAEVAEYARFYSGQPEDRPLEETERQEKEREAEFQS